MPTTLFLTTLIAAYLTPGPDMILMLQTVTRLGRSPALAVAGGLAAARGLHVVLAASGMSLLFAMAPWLLAVVQVAGAAWLAWLGARILGSAWRSGAEDANPASAPSRLSEACRRGFLTNALNPKSLLFCSVLLPQFVVPEAGPVAGQFALLGLLVVATGVVFDLLLVLAAGRFDGRRAGRLSRLVQGLFGALLLGFGAELLWSGLTRP